MRRRRGIYPIQVIVTSTLLAGPEKVTVYLEQPTVIATRTDCPGESFPLDGLTEAPLLDADHFRETLPVLVSFV